MKKTEKRKTAFLIGVSIVAIILLIFVNIKTAKTSQDEYAKYFAAVTNESVNLTRAFQDEIALWQLGQISNTTMAKITEDYLQNFTTQKNEFNSTASPEIFKSTKENLLNSFVNEIKSYEFFRDYLLTGNVTKNNLSIEYLSKALEDEASSFRTYEKIVNDTNS